MTTHELRWRFPVPGSFAAPDGGGDWIVQWEGVAIMGIVNVTPDSFSDGGDFAAVTDAIAHARQLAHEGALIVDVGGESTRPGAASVDESTEIARVVPVIEALHADADVLISVDTRHASVARAAIQAGAHIVNDVSGLRDLAMIDVCAAAGVPVVIMHMLGDPGTMQTDPTYDDVVVEVAHYLNAAAQRALAAGVPSVVIDPGIGFGKTVDQNVQLIRGVRELGEHPVLVGASRKRFIGLLTNTSEPKRRLPGTLAAHMVAAHNGAAIVRVHDVAAHRQTFVIFESCYKGGS